MDGAVWVLIGAILFVGSHFLMSHPLRAGLVERLGEGPFLILYSLVSFLTFGLLFAAFWLAPATAPWWTVGDVLWAVVTAAMLVASVLFVGAFMGGNPAFPNPTARDRAVPEPSGAFRITRHPMLWGIGLWGLCHMIIMPTATNIVFAGAMAFLALVGAALQDRKKAKLQPQLWSEWSRRTSYRPFARGVIWPGWAPLLVGLALWLGATWAHMPLAGWPAGIWRWIA